MDKFQAFSKAILDASNEGLDVDGFTIQKLAEKHKVIVVVPYDPNKHGPNEFDVMPGEDWYEYVPELCSPDTSPTRTNETEEK